MHLLIVIDDPAVCPNFVGYIKRESSHMVNRLLGRKQHTVWQEGYDASQVLDMETAIRRFVYLYTNPTQAGLEDTIDLYPNLTSWKYFLAGSGHEIRNRITRKTFPQLPNRNLSPGEHQKIHSDIIEESHEEFELIIEPDFWLNCFEESEGTDPEISRKKILDGVRAKEHFLREHRSGGVKGAHALKLESIRTRHTPKKRGKRMICFCSIPQLRKAFIKWVKSQSSLASDAYFRWKGGDFTAQFPPGFFLPGGSLLSNLNPIFILA